MKNAEHVKLHAAMLLIHTDEAEGGDYHKGMDIIKGMLETPAEPSNEVRNFRWAYAAVVALAKRALADANAEVAGTNTWPAGQDWDGLGGTSKATFMRRAREEAGIPHDEFLEGIRSGEYEIDDLFGD